jgi:hypothetical protein
MTAKKRNISELQGNKQFLRFTLKLPLKILIFSDFLKLDGPMIEYLWETGLPHPSRRPWGPPSLLRNEYGLFPGVKSTGVWRWLPPHHLVLRLKKEYSYTSTPSLGLDGLL